MQVVYQVLFSPDSRWAATAKFRREGQVWSLGAGSEPKVIADPTFKDRVLQAAFSPDNLGGFRLVGPDAQAARTDESGHIEADRPHRACGENHICIIQPR